MNEAAIVACLLASFLLGACGDAGGGGMFYGLAALPLLAAGLLAVE